MSEELKQVEDKFSNDAHSDITLNLVELGKQRGNKNAHGGHSVGTGGHGTSGSNIFSSQPVGGNHVLDTSQFNQEQLHPGLNPDPVERGRLLGQRNAHGGRSVGTGGHGSGK